MVKSSIAQEYDRWLSRAVECSHRDLEELANDEAALEDAFYRDLSFGTGGLRGVLGPGPNRMNIYTVAKATQGISNYLNVRSDSPSVAIARDSRINGELFMQVAAGVLAANGIHVYVYPRVEPTPALSFAVRDLGCDAGICLTASHNAAEYNGYKVYGSDGCQITTEVAKCIQGAIDDVDAFDDVKRADFYSSVTAGIVSWIEEGVLNRYFEAIMCSLNDLENEAHSRESISVVYTPLNGTGFECVNRISSQMRMSNMVVVPEQAMPDGRFLTCPYPNPEFRGALERALEISRRVHPDLLVATDPDADRVGAAVPSEVGEYELITGNEMGILLLDYICKMRVARGENLREKVVVTTVVSAPMADDLSESYGFELRRTLTGFKFIGEQISLLESEGEENRFIFGFEESYGYLIGAYVRDKDAISATALIFQMTRYYKTLGVGLLEVLDKLYARFGHYRTGQVSVEYPGADGAQKMQAILGSLRANAPREIAGMQVKHVIDYASGVEMPRLGGTKDDTRQMLPSADVLEYQLEGGTKLMIRPSGTEPKVKAYLFAKGQTAHEADCMLRSLEIAARAILS